MNSKGVFCNTYHSNVFSSPPSSRSSFSPDTLQAVLRSIKQNGRRKSWRAHCYQPRKLSSYPLTMSAESVGRFPFNGVKKCTMSELFSTLSIKIQADVNRRRTIMG